MTWKRLFKNFSDISGKPERPDRAIPIFPKMLKMVASYLFWYQINFEYARD